MIGKIYQEKWKVNRPGIFYLAFFVHYNNKSKIHLQKNLDRTEGIDAYLGEENKKTKFEQLDCNCCNEESLFLAHPSRRFIGELKGYAGLRHLSIVHTL